MIQILIVVGAFLAGFTFALILTQEERVWRRYRQAALDELYRQAVAESEEMRRW